MLALDRIPERTRSLISYHARRLTRLGIGDGCDDLVQELCLRLWVATRRYDPARGSWSAFATATLRNAARMLAREQFAAKRQRLRSIGDRDPCDPRGDADRLACERRRDFAATLATLSPALQTLARDLSVDNLSVVARRLHIPRTTLQGRIGELRRKFAAFTPEPQCPLATTVRR